jgi:tetratricopeptide (TPR) repeat protein
MSYFKLKQSASLEQKLLALLPRAGVLWVVFLVNWLAERAIKPLRPTANMLEQASQQALDRPTAVRMALQATRQDSRFQDLVGRGDALRDDGKFEEAELCYKQALHLFPLHSGYRVQYAHALKEQQKHVDAFVHYCFALGTGAPIHVVTEHLLFAARRAEIEASLANVERLASAWATAERTSNLWDAPPIESDFIEFARLLWGNAGLITSEFEKSYLLKCVTRRELFVSFLRSSETLRANPRLFVLLHERGLDDV